MQTIDKLAWIEVKGRKLLSTRTRGRRTWYIPGGKRENGESDVEALTREIQEELSVALIRDSILHYGDFEAQADGHPEGVQVRMQCYTADYMGQLRPAGEIEELDWLTSADLDRVSPVDRLIVERLRAEGKIG